MHNYLIMNSEDLMKIIEMGEKAKAELQRRERVNIQKDVEQLNKLLDQAQTLVMRITEKLDELEDAGTEIRYSDDVDWLRGGVEAEIEDKGDYIYFNVRGF